MEWYRKAASNFLIWITVTRVPAKKYLHVSKSPKRSTNHIRKLARLSDTGTDSTNKL